jgi:hypothetical protein
MAKYGFYYCYAMAFHGDYNVTRKGLVPYDSAKWLNSITIRRFTNTPSALHIFTNLPLLPIRCHSSLGKQSYNMSKPNRMRRLSPVAMKWRRNVVSKPFLNSWGGHGLEEESSTGYGTV